MHIRSGTTMRTSPSAASSRCGSGHRTVAIGKRTNFRCVAEAASEAIEVPLSQPSAASTATATAAKAIQELVGNSPEKPATHAESTTGSNEQRLRQKGKRTAATRNNETIIVKEKPVTKSILNRLQEVPQTVLRAASSDDQTTYKAVSSIASAQKQLQVGSKVLVFVPYVRASCFTAQLLTADASITEGVTGTSLTVNASTDPAALGNTVALWLLQHSGVSVTSAGAAATARGIEAIRLARGLLVKKGYELGVVPVFKEGSGRDGNKFTILQQDVVLQKLPAAEVTLPSYFNKPVDQAAARASAALRTKQGVCTVHVPRSQLSRFTEVLHKMTQSVPVASREAAPEAAETAGQVGTPEASVGGSPGKERTKTITKASKQPATASQSTARVSASGDLPAAASTPAGDDGPVEGSSVSGATTDTATKQAAAAADRPPRTVIKSFNVQSSRLTFLPEPRWGLMGPEGPMYARKPVVVTAASGVNGAAAALQAKLARCGAAWLYTDGSPTGNKIAWEVVAKASETLPLTDRTSARVLALVKTQQGSDGAEEHEGSSGQQQSGDGGQVVQQGAEEVQASSATAQQQQQQPGVDDISKQASRQPLSMLLVPYHELSLSIMQTPNAPLELTTQEDAISQISWLIKFAAAANSFMPMSTDSGTGGLLLLPAALTKLDVTKQAAADSSPLEGVYDAATDGVHAPLDTRDQSESTPDASCYYHFRVQRYTEQLTAGLDGPGVRQMRVAASTDPTKLRDALVATVLEGQEASLKFRSQAGSVPLLAVNVGLAALAAARLRLQDKKAGVDVGVMPLVLPSEDSSSSGKNSEDVQVIYSLRLVRLPPPAGRPT